MSKVLRLFNPYKTPLPEITMKPLTKTRIESIDLLRGIVIVIMALDHVRDYFHAGNFLYDPTDLQHTSVPVFFTRWITHFCAPTFMFLAGTSAFLVGERKTKKQLSKFLFLRGLWLILLELFILNFAWSFNPQFYFFRLQVIWALGLCMVVLSGIVYLPKNIILILGLIILVSHNMLDTFHVNGNSISAFLWGVLHERERFNFAGHVISTTYPVLPWIGIMCLGYCFGQFYQKGIDAASRKKHLLFIGFSAIILFILLRGLNLYGDKSPWSYQSSFAMTICSFLNTTKYPPSLLYTLMTLGPAIIFLALSEKPLGWIGKRIIHFGRAPLFFYLLHIYFIHLLATFAVVLSGRPWTDMIAKAMINFNDSPWLAGYGFSLLSTYLVWIAVVLSLYPLCRWYEKYKSSHKEKWWLSYI